MSGLAGCVDTWQMLLGAEGKVDLGAEIEVFDVSTL